VLKRAVEAGAGEKHGDIHQDPRIDRTIYREPIDFSRFPSDQSIDKKNGHLMIGCLLRSFWAARSKMLCSSTESHLKKRNSAKKQRVEQI
jgi:hypothetical protein